LQTNDCLLDERFDKKKDLNFNLKKSKIKG